MRADRCHDLECPKRLGPARIKIGFCIEHGPNARQCKQPECGTWLSQLNRDGFCNTHRPKAAQARARQKANPVRTMLVYARYRAKQRGIPFSITPEDITIPARCPILGTPLDFSDGSRTEPSLDRRIPELGYIPGNVWVISTLANSMKWNASAEDLLAFSRYWVSQEAMAEQWTRFIREQEQGS